MRIPTDPRAGVPLVALEAEFKRGLGLFDSTMVVAGSMIGVGIFVVSAAMARQVGSPAWLLVSWGIAAVLTFTAALSYGELAGMMPRAGGQYIYLREAFSPFWGFLYGWTLFLVIQTGTISAVAVGFARYFGVLWPWVAEDRHLITPIHLSAGYALSLTTTQLVGILLITFLTWANARGLEYGKLIQNVFTTVKGGLVLAIVVVGLTIGWNTEAVHENFANLWTPRGMTPIAPGVTAATAAGLFVAMCVAQTGSLFAADAWNNITFVAAEVKHPQRNIPLSLALGTGVVMTLYFLTNLAYLVMLPLGAVQNAPADRVATAALGRTFPGLGVTLVAVGIIISSFGCDNGLVLTGARTYYAMARDGVFFKVAGRLSRTKVPAWGLVLQGMWAALLVVLRTYNPTTKTYGNVYTDLLEYVVAVALFFYILTIAGVFRLRAARPDADRPYRAFGYPILPALYICVASAILIVLLLYQPSTTWPGLLIVVAGIPVYWFWRRKTR